MILECLAAFFLFLSIIRPLIRGLWKLHGLTTCPLLALGIIIGIFPSYGFRPECIPLLLFALFLVIANLQDLTALFSGLQSDSYRDKGIFFTLSSAAVFAFTLWITVHYAPPVDTDLSTEGVKTLFLQGGRLHIRIYGPAEAETMSVDPADTTAGPESNPGRPLLILLPPVAGSFTVTDEVCSILRDRGFTILAYSRLNFDSPSFDRNGMPVRLFIPGFLRLANVLTRGLSDKAANNAGRELEQTRKQDTIFLLEELSRNKTLIDHLAYTDRDTVFLTGYGAGGAALTVLAGQDDFTVKYPQLRGIIAIESPLLSSLEGDPLPPPLPPPTDPVKAFYQQTKEFAESFIPRKITHIADIPQPALPVLFVLSDHVIQKRTGRYETILRTLGASRNIALIAAVPGAGLFDYSDSPRYYPLLSFLFRGAAIPESQTEKRIDWPEMTSSLVANFAAFILENETEMPDMAPSPLVKTALDNIYLELGGVWHIPDSRTILHP